MPLGCLTNCLPFALPARFAFVVAAYSAGLKALIAFSGKYRSPVFDDGLPLLVRHFWSPQFFSDCCGAFNLCIPHLPLYTSWLLAALCGLTTALHRCHALLPLSLAPQSAYVD